jgi:hypothetical protein
VPMRTSCLRAMKLFSRKQRTNDSIFAPSGFALVRDVLSKSKERSGA